MYLRLTQRRNRDGTVVRYVQLAHNRRVDGQARAEVVANLGREDQIDLAALRGLVASIGRYLDRVEPAPGPEPARPSAPTARPPAQPRSAWTGPPVGLDRLIGRDRALADLPALLTRHPLVTITGPAGVGKTRLAAEFGHRARGRYRRRAWWVDLAPLPPASPVDSAVAAALGVGAEPGRDVRDAIAGACGPGPALLVLDNCEHVVDCCAELVGWLLGTCPKLRVLATSREGLRIPGETLFPLAPLAVPAEAADDARDSDAVRLFVDRAGAASPEFELTDELAVMVGQLCVRLDGLPLAIELTARQLTTLTLPQLLHRLDDRLDVLTGGSRAAPDRHRSLRAAIGWGYELLDPTERAVFRRLCVVPGGFDQTGAAAVCTGLGLTDAELWATLRALVDKSMLVPDRTAEPAVRLRILESLQAFGIDQLVHEGELEQTRERFLAWLAELVEPLIAAPLVSSDLLRRVYDERHNLHHAGHLLDAARDPRYPRIAVGLAFVVRKQGQLPRSRDLMTGVLRRYPEPTPARAAALSSLAMTENWAGDFQAARRYAERSLELAERLGNAALQERASHRLGLVLSKVGDFDRAVELLNRSVAAIRVRGDGETLPMALNDLAWLLVYQGDLTAAAGAADEALAVWSAAGKDISPDLLHTAGAIAYRQGQLDQAGLYFRLALADDPSYTAAVQYNLEGLALVAAASGRPERALRLAAAAAASRPAGGRNSDPWWTRMCEETMEAARGQLGGPLAASAGAEGARLSTVDAIRYALLDQWPPARRSGRSPLTSREHQVARLVADGLTNPQIAARLGVSPRTVVNHLEHIKTKLDVGTRTEIAAWTMRTSG